VKHLFLGKWWHWLVLVVVTALLWIAGEQRLHVVHFNLFVVLLLVGSVAVLTLLLTTTKPGEQVTRDKLD